MSARLQSAASEEVELVMMEETGVSSHRPEYAKKIRIYHQIRALVSLIIDSRGAGTIYGLITEHLPPRPFFCHKLTRSTARGGNSEYSRSVSSLVSSVHLSPLE